MALVIPGVGYRFDDMTIVMQAGEGVKRTKRRPRWGWLPVFERRLGPQHAVLIAGSGRSGTTWLAQLVNHDHSYRYYHEPFGPAVSPALRPVLYLRRGNRDERYVIPVERVLHGQRVWNWLRSRSEEHTSE